MSLPFSPGLIRGSSSWVRKTTDTAEAQTGLLYFVMPNATSDAAPSVMTFISGHAYAQASSNTTGAVLRLAPGIGRRFITVDDYAQAGTGTVTVTVNGTATVLTAGTDFTAATSNAVTATNLATAIEAIAGVSATAVSAVVYVTPDDSTYTLTLARSVAAFATVTSGTDGNLTLVSGQLLLPTSSAGTPGIMRSGDDTYEFGLAFVNDSELGLQFVASNTAHFGLYRALGLVIGATYQTVWGSSGLTAPDTGLKRAAAGVVQVTDGSTGMGALYATGISNSSGSLVNTIGDGNVMRVVTGVKQVDLNPGTSSITVTSANGQVFATKILTELTTIAAAATTDTTIEAPAGALVLAVSVRVTTVIPTAATFTVTGAGSGTTFNTAAVSVAADTTNVGTAAGAYYNSAAQKIRITPNLTPGDTTGRVRVTIHYIDITPPTS